MPWSDPDVVAWDEDAGGPSLWPGDQSDVGPALPEDLVPIIEHPFADPNPKIGGASDPPPFEDGVPPTDPDFWRQFEQADEEPEVANAPGSVASRVGSSSAQTRSFGTVPEPAIPLLLACGLVLLVLRRRGRSL